MDEYGKITIFYWKLTQATWSGFHNRSVNPSQEDEYHSLIQRDCLKVESSKMSILQSIIYEGIPYQ